MDKNIIFFLLLMTFSTIKCAVPGTFFWRPRLGLDLSIPTTEITMAVAAPNMANVRAGLVVMIDGYQVGLTVVGLASGLSNAKPYPHLNPVSAYFYTNAYRWLLRHLSLYDILAARTTPGPGYIHGRRIEKVTVGCDWLIGSTKRGGGYDTPDIRIPGWIGGGSGSGTGGGENSYCDTHRVWQRRFFYMDEFVPEWLRHLFPYVDKKEWQKEEMEFKRFKKYAEPAFGKHYRYPNRHFNNFKSQETKESEEVIEHSSSSDT